MSRHTRIAMIRLGCITFALFAQVSVSHAGLMDKLKKKGENKAKEAAESVVDEKAGEVTGEVSSEAEAAETDAAESGREEAGSAKAGGNEQVSEVSTKFDYVPGDKVLLFDDFTQDAG